MFLTLIQPTKRRNIFQMARRTEPGYYFIYTIYRMAQLTRQYFDL